MDFQDFRQAQPGDAVNAAMLDAREWSMATAGELMFFGGAPLAHVVAYREHLRMAGIRRRNIELSERMRSLRPARSGHLLTGWEKAR